MRKELEQGTAQPKGVDDRIAEHSRDNHSEDWKGKTPEQIKEAIEDVRNDYQEGYELEGGGKIYRKGDTVLIEDGKGGGTIFKPEGSAADYVQRRLRDR
jgi:hypothetical protein